jgi:hypothetical protein
MDRDARTVILGANFLGEPDEKLALAEPDATLLPELYAVDRYAAEWGTSLDARIAAG